MAVLVEASGAPNSIREREEQYLQDRTHLHDLDRLVARAWAISDVLIDADASVLDAPAAAALRLASVRVVGEALERASRLQGKVRLTLKDVDALADAIFQILRRFVPLGQIEPIGFEIGRAVDKVLGAATVRLLGPVQPDRHPGTPPAPSGNPTIEPSPPGR